MPNDITVTKNTTSGSERWDIQYTADQAGTIDKTLYTAGNLLDRDEKVSITIPNGSATTPATTITPNTIQVSINPVTGLISASNLPKTQDITPNVTNGYVSNGTSGTITVSGANGSLQLSTQAAATITPTTTSQTAVAKGRYTLGVVTVEGDADLIPSNIKTGVNIFGVIGSYSGQSINNQQKSVTPTETAQTVTPDSGYTGLSQVDVGAISSTYVGSGITRRSSTDLTVSGATVTAPAGYYESSASKSVNTMTLPTSTSTTSSGTNKATIGRSTSAQYINIPTGYNDSAAYYTISATPNGVVRVADDYVVSNAGVTISNGVVTLDTIVENATPVVITPGYVSSGTPGDLYLEISGNIQMMTLPTSASSTSSGTAKATVTPNTSAQYINIPTGYNTTAVHYAIAGDADLVASNIKKDVTIFGVTGTYEGGGAIISTTQDSHGGDILTITTTESPIPSATGVNF